MVRDYNSDSLFDKKLDLLLRLVQVEMNVDLGEQKVSTKGLPY